MIARINVKFKFYSKASTNAFFHIASSLIGILSAFLLMPIIVGRLGVLAWGTVATYLLFLALTSFFESGYTTYSRRRFPQIMVADNVAAFQSEYMFLLNVLKFVGSLYLFGLLILIFSGESLLNEKVFVVAAAVLSSFLRILGGFYRSFLAARNSQSSLALINGAAQVLRPCLIAILVLVDVSNLKLLIVGYIFSHILEVVVLKRHASKFMLMHNIGVRVTKAESQSFNRIYGSYCLSALLSVFVLNVDKLFSWLFQADLEFAEYSIYSTLAGLFYVVVNSAVTAFNPLLTEMTLRGKAEGIVLFLRFFNLFNGVLIFLGLLCLLIMHENLFLLLGVDVGYVSLEKLIMLVGSVALQATLWMPVAAMVSKGNVRFVIFHNGFKAITISACLLIFFLKIAPLTVYSAILVASVISSIFITIYIWLEMEVNLVEKVRYVVFSFAPPLLILVTLYYAESLFYSIGQIEFLYKLVLVSLLFLTAIGVLLTGHQRSKEV